MKRTKLIASASAAMLFSLRSAAAAESAEGEPMTVTFDRTCASMATKEELSGPGVVKPRMSPRYPPKQPEYPEEASKRGEEGIVGMLLLVNEDGHVVQAKILNSSGSSVLDRASLEASGEWRLEPGKVNDKAKCMWFGFVFGWKL